MLTYAIVREYFGTEQLEQHLAHLEANDTALETLLKAATVITDMYMSSLSAERARCSPDMLAQHVFFPMGKQHVTSAASPSTQGDDVLANTILRMRDSMFHYEFQSAIADGDIGRAMNIMNVSLISPEPAAAASG